MFCIISTIYKPEINFESSVCKLYVLPCDIVKLAPEIKPYTHYQVSYIQIFIA